MKVNTLPIQDTFDASASKIGILTLAIFMTTAHVTHAASIGASIDTGKHLITHGETLVGPDDTRPGGDFFTNQNATATNFTPLTVDAQPTYSATASNTEYQGESK